MSGFLSSVIPQSLRGLFYSGNTADPSGQTEQPGQQPEEEQPPLSTQIKLSDREMNAIRTRINSDYSAALDAHQTRLARCVWQERMWREKVGMPGGESGESNFRVPITTALVFAKHAREIDAMFGPRASVLAVPRGPSDSKASKKISIAMSWQFFENMKAIKPIALWALRRLKHGRSFALVPWETRFYSKYANGQNERVKYQSSPTIRPLDNDEIMLPADVQGCQSIQDAAWVKIDYVTTPTEMLLKDNEPGLPQTGEGDWYQGIAPNFEKIVRHGRQGIRRDAQSEGSKIQTDADEGVIREGQGREHIKVEEWYIRWRLEYVAPETEIGDSAEIAPDSEETLETAGKESDRDIPRTFIDADGVRREMLETHLLVRFVRDLEGGLICGVQRLAELYPDTPTKIPVMDLALLNDGQFWCQGLVEMCEDIEQEMSLLANRLIEAVGMSIAPPIFVEPTVGENFMNRKYGTYDLIPTANAAGVKQMQINPQTEPFAQLWMLFTSLWEQLTGISNLNMGRGMDQPNAPRTLGGQRLVMGAGDVRLALDMRMLSEDLKNLLEWVWDLWRMMGSEQEFYRVAEGDAPRGLFAHGEITDGFAQLSAKEREASYDLSFEFADDMQVREGRKQEISIVATFLSTLPIFINNPAAQYRFAIDLCEIFNIDFTGYMDEPPPLFIMRTSQLEWTLLLEGEDIHVHPNDNDQEHIDDFNKRMMAMMKAPVEDQDHEAMFRAYEHVQEHEQALVEKRQMQEMMAGLQGMVQAAAGALGGKGGQQQNPMAGLLGASGGQPPQPGGMA